MKGSKICVVVLLIGSLLLSPIYVFGESSDDITEVISPEIYLDEGDMQRTLNSSSVSFGRDSATVGAGRAYAYTSGIATYIKMTVTLQEAALGSTSYGNSSQSPVSKTVYDTNYIYKAYTFKVTTNKNYRVKVVVTDKTNGVVSTKTLYKKLT